MRRANRVAAVPALVEGCSIRATVRLTGVAKNTIVKVLVELGDARTKYQDATLRNRPCKRLQRHAIWAVVGGKDKKPVGRKARRRTRFGLDVDSRRCQYEADPFLARLNA